MKKIFAVWPSLFFLLLLSLLCRPAVAVNNCALPAGATPFAAVFHFPTIIDARSTPVGGVIASSSATVTRANTAVCDAAPSVGGITYANGSNAPAVNGDNTIIPSGVAGVGVRFFVNGGYFPSYPNRQDGLQPSASLVTWTISFVKTSTAGSGNAYTGPAYTWRVGDNKLVLLSLSSDNYITFLRTPTSCVVNNSNTLVNLGALSSSTFSGVGTASSAVPVNIGVDCTGVTANVRMSVTDQNNPANTTNTMALSGSTAAGVGIQILANGTPMNFGPDPGSNSPGSGVLVGSTIGGATLNSLQGLTARYVQNAAAVTPGTAKGVATFTLNYD